MATQRAAILFVVQSTEEENEIREGLGSSIPFVKYECKF